MNVWFNSLFLSLAFTFSAVAATHGGHSPDHDASLTSSALGALVPTEDTSSTTDHLMRPSLGEYRPHRTSTDRLWLSVSPDDRNTLIGVFVKATEAEPDAAYRFEVPLLLNTDDGILAKEPLGIAEGALVRAQLVCSKPNIANDSQPPRSSSRRAVMSAECTSDPAAPVSTITLHWITPDVVDIRTRLPGSTTPRIAATIRYVRTVERPFELGADIETARMRVRLVKNGTVRVVEGDISLWTTPNVVFDPAPPVHIHLPTMFIPWKEQVIVRGITADGELESVLHGGLESPSDEERDGQRQSILFWNPILRKGTIATYVRYWTDRQTWLQPAGKAFESTLVVNGESGFVGLGEIVDDDGARVEVSFAIEAPSDADRWFQE